MALQEIIDNGIESDASVAKELLSVINKQQECGRCATLVIWDVLEEVNDIWTQQFPIGNLNMVAVDYGGKLRLTSTMQQFLGEGEPTEQNQCAIVALASAAEWNAQNWKAGIPIEDRDLLSATSIREVEPKSSREGKRGNMDCIKPFRSRNRFHPT